MEGKGGEEFESREFCSVYSVFIVPTGTLRLP